MRKRKRRNLFWIINIVLLVIFVFFFFIKAIPIPVKNITGEFGGFYYTSVLYELSVGNYLGCILFIFIFVIFLGLNCYLYKKDKGLKKQSHLIKY